MNFDVFYAGRTPFGASPPWDIGRPQPEFVKLHDAGLIKGRILDLGCGTGQHANYLARRGHEVVGVDLSRLAIRRARHKATGKADFEVADAFAPHGHRGLFDTILDCGLFECCPPDDRPNHAARLHEVCRPGGHVCMLELSAASTAYMRQHLIDGGMPADQLADLPLLAPHDIRTAFTNGWHEEWLEESTMLVQHPANTDLVEVPAIRAGFRRLPDRS